MGIEPEYFITYDRLLGSDYPRKTPDGVAYELPHAFYVCEGKQRNWFKHHLFSRLTPEAFTFQLPAFLSEHDQATFDDVVLRWCVRRIDEEFRSGFLESPMGFLDIDAPDFEILRSLADRKSCDYQVREKRDLFCSASSQNDLAKIGTIGLRTLAATSIPTCNDCDLPAGEYLCSHLTHPKVLRNIGGLERNVIEAKCDLGRPEIQHPALCHASQNSCWAKRIERNQEKRPPAYVSPALSKALDYLDAVWRLRFAIKDHLVIIGSAGNIATLEADCTNAEQFERGLSALCDTFRRLQVPDSLLDTTISADQTLKRLKAALDKLLGGASEQITGSIETLQAINEWRTAAQHTGTKANRALAEKMLGIRYYPSIGWAAVWNELRSKAVQALDRISQERRDSE
jgi:hypothetical protein